MTTRRPGSAPSAAVARANPLTLNPLNLWTVDLDDAPVAVALLPRVSTRAVVAGADGLLALMDLTTGQILRSEHVDGGLLDVAAAPAPAPASTPAPAPAPGETVVAMCGPRGYGTWLPDATSVDATSSPLRWCHTRRWTARLAWNGQRRLAVTSGRNVLVTDADLAEIWSSPEHASTVTDLCWLDAGRRIAATSYGGVTVHRPGQADPVAQYSYVGSHLAVVIPAGDRWVVTGNQDATIHLWRRVPTGGDGDELHMSGYPGKISRLVFDPTGRWLAADGAPEVTVWDFAGRGPGGRSPRFLPGHDEVTALAWSPSRAGLLATGGSEGRVAVWQPGRGAPGKGQKPILVHDSRDRSGAAGRSVAPAGVTTVTWAGPDRLLIGLGDGRVSLIRVEPPSA